MGRKLTPKAQKQTGRCCPWPPWLLAASHRSWFLDHPCKPIKPDRTFGSVLINFWGEKHNCLDASSREQASFYGRNSLSQGRRRHQNVIISLVSVKFSFGGSFEKTPQLRKCIVITLVLGNNVAIGGASLSGQDVQRRELNQCSGFIHWEHFDQHHSTNLVSVIVLETVAGSPNYWENNLFANQGISKSCYWHNNIGTTSY